mmetsp:Transcript_26763/g.53772  ORF Transcript_26763/g.53772 Transcript_26763/m.53772 type:complete len:240 (-) Transcript_26763:160-879(-)
MAAQHSDWGVRLATLLIDPMSDASVEHAACELAAQGTILAGIVNNAGGFLPLPQMLNLHLYGPKRVTEALLPLLEPNAAVVNVSSGGSAVCVARSRDDRRAFMRRIDLSWEQIDAFAQEVLQEASLAESHGTDEAERTGVEWSLGGYGFTKALLNCYTCWLQAEHPSLRATAVNPGFIETDLSRPFLRGRAPEEIGMRPAVDGAKAICAALFAPSRRGQYLDHDMWRDLDEVNPRDFSA